MYPLGINSNQIYAKSAVKAQAQTASTSAPVPNTYVQNPIKHPTFSGVQPYNHLRTELTTKDEKEKYSQVLASMDKHDKKNLELLLKNGVLLSTNSNDKSSTLDNLHKIISSQRASGLDSKTVLKETINTIANPFTITQNFGDIPQVYIPDILKSARTQNTSTNLLEKAKINSIEDDISEKSINVSNSGACVAASIEFNLAKQMPAEFARFSAELTSPNVAVEKTINLNNLANNTLDSVWLLNSFDVPYEMKDFNSAKLKLAPDKNALIRAQIQNSNKDGMERSLVDVLMQSTFMNVGSQQSYNSLTDIRKGKFNDNDRGLIEFEKTFTESVVEDKNKISVTYQIVDEDGKLTGYETDFKTMKKHITDSLAMGENVIIGYTQMDDKNTIVNGHEITIIGAKQDDKGKLTFICNDTDDDNPNPIEYSEDYIIPKIHHAGLLQEVVEKDIKYVDNWVAGVDAYKTAKQSLQKQRSAKAT